MPGLVASNFSQNGGKKGELMMISIAQQRQAGSKKEGPEALSMDNLNSGTAGCRAGRTGNLKDEQRGAVGAYDFTGRSLAGTRVISLLMPCTVALVVSVSAIRYFLTRLLGTDTGMSALKNWRKILCMQLFSPVLYPLLAIHPVIMYFVGLLQVDWKEHKVHDKHMKDERAAAELVLELAKTKAMLKAAHGVFVDTSTGEEMIHPSLGGSSSGGGYSSPGGTVHTGPPSEESGKETTLVITPRKETTLHPSLLGSVHATFNEKTEANESPLMRMMKQQKSKDGAGNTRHVSGSVIERQTSRRGGTSASGSSPQIESRKGLRRAARAGSAINPINASSSASPAGSAPASFSPGGSSVRKGLSREQSSKLLMSSISSLDLDGLGTPRSVATVEQRIIGAFKAFDADGSGELDVFELRAAMNKLATSGAGDAVVVAVTNKEALEMLEQGDTDHNGGIDLEVRCACACASVGASAFASVARGGHDGESRGSEVGSVGVTRPLVLVGGRLRVMLKWLIGKWSSVTSGTLPSCWELCIAT